MAVAEAIITPIDAIMSFVANGIALPLTIYTSFLIWRQQSKESKAFSLLIITVNIFTVSFSILGVSFVAFSVNAGLIRVGRTFFTISENLSALLITLLALLDVRILEKFRSMESRISSRLIRNLNGCLIGGYLILAFPGFAVLFIPATEYPSLLSTLNVLGFLVLATSCILYDNMQAFFLLNLITRWRSNAGQKGVNLLLYRRSIMISAFGVGLDWLAIVTLITAIVLGRKSGIYSGLEAIGIAISSIHMTNSMHSLRTLTNLAMGRGKQTESIEGPSLFTMEISALNDQMDEDKRHREVHPMASQSESVNA